MLLQRPCTNDYIYVQLLYELSVIAGEAVIEPRRGLSNCEKTFKSIKNLSWQERGMQASCCQYKEVQRLALLNSDLD